MHLFEPMSVFVNFNKTSFYNNMSECYCTRYNIHVRFESLPSSYVVCIAHGILTIDCNLIIYHYHKYVISHSHKGKKTAMKWANLPKLDNATRRRQLIFLLITAWQQLSHPTTLKLVSYEFHFFTSTTAVDQMFGDCTVNLTNISQ